MCQETVAVSYSARVVGKASETLGRNGILKTQWAGLYISRQSQGVSVPNLVAVLPLEGTWVFVFLCDIDHTFEKFH